MHEASTPQKIRQFDDVVASLEWDHFDIPTLLCAGTASYLDGLDETSVGRAVQRQTPLAEGWPIDVFGRHRGGSAFRRRHQLCYTRAWQDVDSLLAHRPVHSTDPQYRQRFGSLHIKGPSHEAAKACLYSCAQLTSGVFVGALAADTSPQRRRIKPQVCQPVMTTQ